MTPASTTSDPTETSDPLTDPLIPEKVNEDEVHSHWVSRAAFPLITAGLLAVQIALGYAVHRGWFLLAVPLMLLAFVGSEGLPKEVAARIPEGAEVVIWPHQDRNGAGEKAADRTISRLSHVKTIKKPRKNHV